MSDVISDAIGEFARPLRCDCGSCDNILGLSRELNGVSTFTGIVSRGGNEFFKLNNPRGELDGPGHAMSANEFLSEMAMYDGSEHNRIQVEMPVLDMRGEADRERFLPDKENGLAYDVAFPWSIRSDGSIFAHVRSGDTVRVVNVGTITGKCENGHEYTIPTTERFWLYVVSVTAGGTIIAIPASQLKWSPFGPHAPVYFDATAVVCVRHGEHW